MYPFCDHFGGVLQLRLNRFDCQVQILDKSGRDSDKPGLDLDRIPE